MATPIKLPLPLKGVNKYTARGDQPPGTTPSALNVLPFDRFGRSRIAQRPGTGKLWDTAIGSTTSFIQMIQQTAIGLATDSLVDGAATVSDSFTYADGNLETESSSVWKTYNTSFIASTASGVMDVTSDAVGNSNDGHAVLQTAITPGTSYEVKMKFTTGSTLQGFFHLMSRINTADANASRLDVVVHPIATNPTINFNHSTTGFVPDSGTRTITLASGSFVADTTYELKIVWVNDAYTVYLDGVQQFTGTTTISNSYTGVGIGDQDTGGSIDDFSVTTQVRAATTRETDIVAIANGNVYMGNPGDQATEATSGSSVVDVDSTPCGAVLFGKMYITDGGNDLAVLDIATSTVSTWSSSAGSETATTLGAYKIAVPWRGRLVLGHDVSSPQNFVASAVGDPTDFDYAGTTPDAAYEGNAATFGQISDPITALIPATDDVLIIGTDHGIHEMRGDISAGGSINLVSDAIGVLSQTAWTKAPDGTVYFVGTTGLFSYAPGSSAPVLLSDKSYNEFFRTINRETMYVNLAWDRDRHGCFIFVTPVASGTATHLYFDAREGGLWPLQYPNSHGPTAVCVYDGDDPTDRYLLMGGRTGLVQIQSDTNRTDDATAITANCTFGPFLPASDSMDAEVVRIDITPGEVFTGDALSVWNMNWKIRAGKTAYEVTDGTSRRFAAGNMGLIGYQPSIIRRVRGGWFSLELSNSVSANYFSVEKVVVFANTLDVQR